jgi:hypothetical protein
LLIIKLFHESKSQAGQESFVLSVLNEKHNGTYLEIGAFDAFENSNTFLLETQFNWSGIAIEIQKRRAKKYNKMRRNKCLSADALTLDYDSVLEASQLGTEIDYLQLDIEPAVNTYTCLSRIPFSKYRFKTITFEHDLYCDIKNRKYQSGALSLLNNYGYVRVVENVKNQGNPFEDWYVHSDHTTFLKNIRNLKNVEWVDLFDTTYRTSQ